MSCDGKLQTRKCGSVFCPNYIKCMDMRIHWLAAKNMRIDTIVRDIAKYVPWDEMRIMHHVVRITNTNLSKSQIWRLVNKFYNEEHHGTKRHIFNDFYNLLGL